MVHLPVVPLMVEVVAVGVALIGQVPLEEPEAMEVVLPQEEILREAMPPMVEQVLDLVLEVVAAAWAAIRMAPGLLVKAAMAAMVQMDFC